MFIRVIFSVLQEILNGLCDPFYFKVVSEHCLHAHVLVSESLDPYIYMGISINGGSLKWMVCPGKSH